MKKKNRLVLIRHGESLWNQLNQFTGWTDVQLSIKGKKEALAAGKLLKKKNFFFDYCYTSVLQRAIHTLWIVLKEINQSWLPVKKTWRLNERHYGKLQGLNKDSVIEKYGLENIQKWRRSFKEIPPKMTDLQKLVIRSDNRYVNLENSEIPNSESLELTLLRILPFWEKVIFPKIQNNKNILIVAHGNSLRALIKYLSKLDEKSVYNLSVPTGIPIIYNIDNSNISKEYKFLKN
ncbi:2,3-diphosphoglycerate-dependent phosphoglycerate mutase [Buchnera aphidicola]|uniref:2,3-diphosphoglycerate-dependent phosphoglycerate mutase n=1 Tax=Buchnera aphidicola TaxID=9 RepID=UPI0031B8B1E2